MILINKSRDNDSNIIYLCNVLYINGYASNLSKIEFLLFLVCLYSKKFYARNGNRMVFRGYYFAIVRIDKRIILIEFDFLRMNWSK